MQIRISMPTIKWSKPIGGIREREACRSVRQSSEENKNRLELPPSTEHETVMRKKTSTKFAYQHKAFAVCL